MILEAREVITVYDMADGLLSELIEDLLDCLLVPGFGDIHIFMNGHGWSLGGVVFRPTI